MSSSILSVNFAFADGTTKTISAGPYAVNAEAVNNFKERVKKINSTDEETQKKFTNLFAKFKSDNGAEITGIKSASITTSSVRRIFDASTYKP